MEQTDYVLETKKLYKSYGSIHALKDINLGFTEKKIYGLFGRNGAGKTTLLNILSSRNYADQGKVTFFGKDIYRNSEIISENCCYMPEKNYFPGRFKVKDLLSQGKMSFPNYSEPYAKKLCQNFKLGTDRKYNQLSNGHQSIFRIIFGMASQAPVTIFDEPILGLDALARDMFYSELIAEFSRHPRLFIISTHLIEESADLFNEVIIMKNGKVIKQAAVDDLLLNVFYVSGKSNQVEQFINKRIILSCQTVNGLKTAVIEGDLSNEKRLPGLRFSPLSIQKLFIYLTNDNIEQELYR